MFLGKEKWNEAAEEAVFHGYPFTLLKGPLGGPVKILGGTSVLALSFYLAILSFGS